MVDKRHARRITEREEGIEPRYMLHRAIKQKGNRSASPDGRGRAGIERAKVRVPASTHTRSRRTIAQPAAFIFSQTGRRGTVSLMRHTRTRAELGRPVLSKIHPPVTLRSDAIPRDYTSRKITVHRKGVTRTGFAGREAGSTRSTTLPRFRFKESRARVRAAPIRRTRV